MYICQIFGGQGIGEKYREGDDIVNRVAANLLDTAIITITGEGKCKILNVFLYSSLLFF
jgi:hypothetical protein